LQQSASSQTFYPQPHSHQVYGQSEKPLKIPLSAIPLRTINRTDAVAPGPAKRTVQRLEESDDEDAEEMAILFSDDKLDTAQDPPKKKSASRASSVVTAEVEDMYVRLCSPFFFFPKQKLTTSSLQRRDRPSDAR
jgi:ubiquitin-conjugating enzyme E2 Q